VSAASEPQPGHYPRRVTPRPRLRARRLARRGRTEAAGATAEAPSAPAGPGARPVATYAAVLDGRHLWLGVDRPGTPALRDAVGGQVVVTAPEALDTVDPGRVPAVLRLPDAPHPDLEAVLVAPDGTTVPVLAGPADGGRVPIGPDGRHRWAAYRAEDASLRLRAEAVPDALVLQGITTAAGALVLRCEPPAPLALLAGPNGPDGSDAGTVVTLAGADDGQGGTAVTPADLVGLAAGPVLVVGAADHRAVRRRADSLPGPGRGAPLPELLDADGTPVLRLRWSPEGVLQGEVLAHERTEDDVA